jgi:hypothetical protein
MAAVRSGASTVISICRPLARPIPLITNSIPIPRVSRVTQRRRLRFTPEQQVESYGGIVPRATHRVGSPRQSHDPGRRASGAALIPKPPPSGQPGRIRGMPRRLRARKIPGELAVAPVFAVAMIWWAVQVVSENGPNRARSYVIAAVWTVPCLIWLVRYYLSLRRRYVAVKDRWRRIRRLKAHTRCVKCGYDLRATPTRCPECGTRYAAS